MNDLWIPAISTGWLLGLWFICTRLDQSSISPGSLFLGYWFFSAVCPMIAWHSSLLLLEKMAGYLLLVGGGTLVFLASIFFRPNRSRAHSAQQENIRYLNRPAIRQLKQIYTVNLILAFLYPVALYSQARTMLGVTSPLDMPGLVSEARYVADWNPGFVVNGLNTFVFTAAALSGLMAADPTLRRRHRFLILTGLLPGVTTYYFTAARTGLLFSAVFWLASYLTCVSYFGYYRYFSFGRFLRNGVLLVTLALPVVHVGYMIRTGTYDWRASMQFWEKSISTAFGHVPVLGHWLASDEFAHLTPFEFKTLAGITEKVGLATREQGLYNISYAIGSDGSVSNIYTYFRPLIEDGRGLVGGGILLFFIAGVASLAWHGLCRGKVAAVPFVFCFQLFTLWGLITSIFIYLSTILAALLASLLIMLVLKRGQPKGSSANAPAATNPAAGDSNAL